MSKTGHNPTFTSDVTQPRSAAAALGPMEHWTEHELVTKTLEELRDACKSLQLNTSYRRKTQFAASLIRHRNSMCPDMMMGQVPDSVASPSVDVAQPIPANEVHPDTQAKHSEVGTAFREEWRCIESIST